MMSSQNPTYKQVRTKPKAKQGHHQIIFIIHNQNVIHTNYNFDFGSLEIGDDDDYEYEHQILKIDKPVSLQLDI